MTQIDDEHASSLAVYDAMGRPRYPSTAQVATLNRAAELPAAQPLALARNNTLKLQLPANALVLLEIVANPRARR